MMIQDKMNNSDNHTESESLSIGLVTQVTKQNEAVVLCGVSILQKPSRWPDRTIQKNIQSTEAFQSKRHQNVFNIVLNR